MSETGDQDHWLWRLSAQQWLSAGQREWQQAQGRLDSRRGCITHLRRAVGMGLNAVLVWAGEQKLGGPGFDPESHWGRSYMDHIQRAAQSPAPLPEHVSPVIERLAQVSLHSPTPALVALRTGPPIVLARAMNDGREILEVCEVFCKP